MVRTSPKGFLKALEIGTVPSGKQDVAVVAISSPPGRVGPARSAERHAMIARDLEEGVWVVGRKVMLDVIEGLYQGVKFERGERLDVFADAEIQIFRVKNIYVGCAVVFFCNLRGQ